MCTELEENATEKKNSIGNVIKTRIPITQWLPQYSVTFLLQDMLAGFTVSLTEISQAIAYAGIAGLPANYGLYSSFLGGFVYAVFGSCKDVNIGPTSIMALMLQSHVSCLGVDVAVLITFLSGLIIFILGLLNLGFVIEFFSYPIIAGFTCAASVQIASSQINNLFGISVKAHTFLESWQLFFENIYEIDKWDTILGILSLLLLIALRELKRLKSKKRKIVGVITLGLALARNAVIVIAGTILAYLLRENAPFKLTGEVQAGFPPIQAPPFSSNCNGTEYGFLDIVKELKTSLIFIPVVSILETISVAKSFSNKSLDATQEILTLGLSNIFSSFVCSMPVTGAFSRSAINKASGVRTQLGGIFTSIMVFLAMAFLTPSFYYVPKATLAAVVVSAMLYLFEYEAFATLWKNRKLDLVPFITTFLCGIFISLEYGILIGIVANLLFVLYPSARPKFDIVREKSGYIVTPNDTLYFPSAEYFKNTILKLEGCNIVVTINGKFIRTIDITVAKSLVSIAEEMEKKNNTLAFSQFKPSIIDVCVGINKNMIKYFKTENCNDVTAV